MSTVDKYGIPTTHWIIEEPVAFKEREILAITLLSAKLRVPSGVFDNHYSKLHYIAYIYPVGLVSVSDYKTYPEIPRVTYNQIIIALRQRIKEIPND